MFYLLLMMIFALGGAILFVKFDEVVNFAVDVLVLIRDGGKKVLSWFE